MRLVLAAGAVVLMAAAQTAQARMDAEEVMALLEARFDLRVLERYTEQITVDGRPAYRVRGMVDRPDTDGHMRLVVFMVDAWTGEMISAFRHLRSGYRLPAGGGLDANRQSRRAPRNGVWR